MWWHRTGKHRRNSVSPGRARNSIRQKRNGSELERKSQEADEALRAVKQTAEQVNRVSDTLKMIRERDDFARLFGDAVGGV